LHGCCLWFEEGREQLLTRPSRDSLIKLIRLDNPHDQERALFDNTEAVFKADYTAWPQRRW
jgi:hypothetical protein